MEKVKIKVDPSSSLLDYHEPDLPTSRLLEYLYRRNYLDENGCLKSSTDASKKRKKYLDDVEFSTSSYNSVLYPSYIKDIGLAEQQFIQNWISETENEQCRRDLEPVLMPLLSHMYIACVNYNSKNACLRFLRRLSTNLITAEWKPFIEQLITVHSPDDVLANETISNFRSSRYQLNLNYFTVILLRRTLASLKLSILITVFHHWFAINIIGDDDSEEEFDTDAESEKSSEDDGDSDKNLNESKTVIESDKEMMDLINTINNKRLESTPAPPLLLYTAHKSEGIVCGRVSNDGRLAATGDKQSEVNIWRLGETRFVPTYHPSYFQSVPIGIESDEFDYSKLQTDKQIWPLRGHSDTVYDVDFVSNDEYLISSSFDTEMRLWKLADLSCIAIYKGHSSPIWGVAVSPILNYVATASHDKTARIWSLDRTYPIRILAGHSKDVTCVRFHPNGTYVATGSSDNSVRLWSVTDGKNVRMFAGIEGLGAVHALAFSPNGQFVAAAGDDTHVWIWDIASAEVVFKLAGNENRIVSIDWGKDGCTLSSASSDGTILLWSLDNKAACTDNLDIKRYKNDCSIMLSVKYTKKNSLTAIGLS